MTEQWFIKDINKLIQHRKRVVLLDPTGQCSFFISVLETAGFTILRTKGSDIPQWQQEKEELFLRHQAETTHKDVPVVFYVPKSQDKLSFLYDYCFTHGCLNLSTPQDWLKSKIHTHTGLQVNLDSPMLLTAAKIGIGKDLVWWKKIVQNLDDIINLNDELLPFLHDPEQYFSTKESDIRRLFEEKIHELLGQQYIAKPALTLAGEVVKKMLDGLAFNEISETLLELYYKWADSTTNRPSLETYIRNYRNSNNNDPWNAHPDHCFEKLDILALQKMAENARDKSWITDKLQKLKPRINSSKAKHFVPVWWKDISVLFSSDVTQLTSCTSLNAVIEYYTTTFSLVDRAIRNLYIHFLNEEAIIRPLQEYYESINHVLLNAWYDYHHEYRSDQQDYLPALINRSAPKTAIIVGDGVRYEIANHVASELQKHYKVEKDIMLADMPSETEHNMSALYLGGNQVVKLHSDREAGLVAATQGRDIGFLTLENLHYGINQDFLILTYKDIDKAGETLQLAAVKLFAEFEAVLIEKISLLLKMGYQNVYLVTDHGFVLTGLLAEADKITANVTGQKDVHERFIRAVDKQSNGDWLEFKVPYGEYKYVYAAKNHRPFKSKGVYGFSHGGFTPQEIIIPKFRFSRIKEITSQLDVAIINKTTLSNVTGELFVIKLEGAKSSADLFASQRKIQIKLYAKNTEYQCSEIINIESGMALDKEFSFNQNSEVKAVVIDAVSLEQLDTVNIKKSNDRDFGGLL